ncbi:DUF4184 family protein [Furfurilactobacillus milii]|uniref:Uncharacterized protein n=1 Tax=Furfurilactobacillus milii TaxID=2888272 RepID=A0A6N9I375_9LACO|nr:DUF4184 family protein [Furfurilactobacillus milii]MYV17257.1 hypothetical protein [Furfurilactobacillus milii]
MDRNKAIEYFKMINGRNPTEQELDKLLYSIPNDGKSASTKKIDQNDKINKREVRLIKITIAVTILVNIFALYHLLKLELRPELNLHGFYVGLSAFGFLIVLIWLFSWRLKLNSKKGRLNIHSAVVPYVSFIAAAGIAVFGVTLTFTILSSHSIYTINVINRRISEGKKLQSLYFDGQYDKVINKNLKKAEKATNYMGEVKNRQNNDLKTGKMLNDGLSDSSDISGMNGTAEKFRSYDFRGTLSKKYLNQLNSRVENLYNFAFQVNLFTEKLDKFGTTGDEQPLSNFFDLNTALKVINSKNYTGQVTTNELETDGFLN